MKYENVSRDEASENWNQKPEPGTRNEKTEIKNQKPETRNLTSEISPQPFPPPPSHIQFACDFD